MNTSKKNEDESYTNTTNRKQGESTNVMNNFNEQIGKSSIEHKTETSNKELDITATPNETNIISNQNQTNNIQKTISINNKANSEKK